MFRKIHIFYILLFATTLAVLSLIKILEINLLEFNVWSILINRGNTSEILFQEEEICVKTKLVICTSNTLSQNTSRSNDILIINTLLNTLTIGHNISEANSEANYNASTKDEQDVLNRKMCVDKIENSNKSETDTLCSENTDRMGRLSRLNEKMKKSLPIQVGVVNLPVWLQITENPNCTLGKCQFYNGDVSESTDVVMVMGVGLQDNHKPPVRWPGQLYVMFAAESPMNYEGSCLLHASSAWRYAFNLTQTYMRDSEIFWPYERLKYEHIPEDQKLNYSEIYNSKKKTAFLFVSHCPTQSLRENYIIEMKKYIDVDVFGRCGVKMSCLYRDESQCDHRQYFHDYKFYLSFENSICEDYVTEKFFKVFSPGRHVVPVVMGGADYDRLLPNGSFINTGWFQTARDLAMYLKVVGQDEATYTQYLKVKDKYRPAVKQDNPFCLLCDALYGDIKPKVYDVYTWLTQQCRPPKSFV